MLDYARALRSTAIGILLSLIWFLFTSLCIEAVTNIVRSYTLVNAVFAWISFAIAVLYVLWNFFHEKLYKLYASLHVFAWIGFWGLTILSQNLLVLPGALLLSFLLFLFLEPILTRLAKLQRIVGVSGANVPAPKDTVDDARLYEQGYQNVPEGAYYKEGEQYSSPEENLGQMQMHGLQSDYQLNKDY